MLKRIIGKFYFYFLVKFKNRKNHLYFPFSSSAYNTSFGNYIKINNNVSLNKCRIGDYSYIGDSSSFLNCKIGKFCSISSNVKVGLGRHPSNELVSTSPIFYSSKGQLPLTFISTIKNDFIEYLSVEIGNDVWIGYHVTIIDGVKIGNGAIIAAGSIVTKDIPDYAIVGGIPAKIIRYRFSPKEIEFLLKFNWWDKDIIWIEEHADLFNDIKVLMEKC
jgi:acetyltransferase-like isoleucine patch superfamily enzyme